MYLNLNTSKCLEKKAKDEGRGSYHGPIINFKWATGKITQAHNGTVSMVDRPLQEVDQVCPIHCCGWQMCIAMGFLYKGIDMPPSLGCLSHSHSSLKGWLRPRVHATQWPRRRLDAVVNLYGSASGCIERTNHSPCGCVASTEGVDAKRPCKAATALRCVNVGPHSAL